MCLSAGRLKIALLDCFTGTQPSETGACATSYSLVGQDRNLDT